MKKGLFATSAIACTLVAGVSLSASAETMLELFEQEMMKDSPEAEFTYDSVVTDTDDGFEITGVRASPEPGEPVITIDRLRVGAMDVDAMMNEDVPEFMDVEAEGFHFPVEMMDPDGQEFFPDGATFDFGISYEIDPATSGLSVRNLSLGMEDFGAFAVSLEVTGVTDEAIGGLMFAGPEALAEVSLSNFSIEVDDDGGLGMLLAMVAEEEGMETDAFVNMALLPQMQMMGAMFAADPVGSAIVTAMMDFIGDFAEPGGTLTITANPDAPVGFMSLMSMNDPTGLPAMLGLSADYDKDGQSGGLFGNN